MRGKSDSEGARSSGGTPDLVPFLCGTLLVVLGAVVCLRGYAQVADRLTFGSPEEAASALAEACRESNEKQLLAILGPLGRELVASGDETADRSALERFAKAFERAHELMQTDEGRQILQVGTESWRLPVPIVKHGESWYFDTMGGKDEMLSRRIESNELSAIKVCRLYVELQTEYASSFHGRGQLPGAYAQKLRSDPGTHNGLYWKQDATGERSPAGTLFELAAQEGYETNGGKPVPFHGYYYRILTAQGESAPGGKKSYFASDDIGILSEKKMTGGFALVAFPAKYGSSGVRSFQVNQEGVVYEKDLGTGTEDLGNRMTEYNPDPSWSRVF